MMKLILGFFLCLGIAHEGLCGIKNADAFWSDKPAKDDHTAILVNFDDATGGSNLAEDIAALAKRGSEDELPPDTVQPPVNVKLLGDAAETPSGRFGKGVKLSGKGAVELGPIVWTALYRPVKAFTIEFSIKPDPGAGRAVLMEIPKTGAETALQIMREADGTITLGAPNGPLLKHSVLSPAGVWTHIAMSICIDPERRLIRLSVNGVAIPGEDQLIGNMKGMLPKLSFGANLKMSDGFKGTVDEIRISSILRDFYPLTDDSFCDRTTSRPTELPLPYFSRRGPLNAGLSFDGTVIPEILSGSVVSGKVAATGFMPGVRGQAIDLAQAIKGGFQVEWTNAIPGETGTLEFWLRPLVWDNLFIGDYLGGNVPSMPLLRISGTGAATSLGHSDLIFRLGRSGVEEATKIPFTPIHPGTWTHVLCTWNTGSCNIYLNGNPQVLNQVRFSGTPRKTSKTNGLETPDPLNATGPFALTFLAQQALLDELRIYPWAFNGMEAKNAYERWFPDSRRQMTALPAIRFDSWYDYNDGTWHLNCRGMPVNEKTPISAHVVMKAAGKSEPLYEGDIKLDAALSGSLNAKLKLPFGDYIIAGVTRAADQTVLGTTNWVYSRKMPDWWQNELGKTKVVPSPWTPIRVQGGQVSVWGRNITLAPGGLPGQIQAVGTNMFTAAVNLHGEANGNLLEFHGEPVEFGQKADDLTEWKSRLKARGILAEIKGSIEYDGMMSFTVTLSAETGAPTLDHLVLDVPFVPDVGSQLIVNGGGGNFRGAWDVRFVPPGTGSVWNSQTSKPGMQKAVVRGSFCPMVWMGDDERGLCFFGENDKGWTPGTNAPAQEIRRENGAVVYRMNIITQPVKLDKARTFSIILQPTPTKPLPKGWRAYNRGGVDGHWANLEGIDACVSPTLTVATNVATHVGMTFEMEPASWPEAIRNGELLKERTHNNPRIFYIDYSWPKLGPSMNDYRSNLWSGGRMLWTREVEDYMTWIINEYIRRDIIDGIYIDDTSFGANFVTFGTAYAMDDGTIQPGFNSLGFRRFLKRVRVLFQQAGKAPLIIPHMTYCFEIPALSFADACVNGEDRDIYYPTERRFSQMWGRDELRIQSSSAKWGFMAYWKNTVVVQNTVVKSEKSRVWQYWQSRAMHSLAIQNDLWIMWADESRGTIEPSLAAIGLDSPDIRFIPDWKRTGMMDVAEVRLLPSEGSADDAPGNTNAVMVCAYARKNRAIMMISNLGTNDQAVTVAVQPAALFEGARAVQFKDADLAMTPPGKPVASSEEIQNAKKSMSLDLSSPDGKPETDTVDDLLSGNKPKDKAKERLALKMNGNSVTVPVRKWDFRLVEIRTAE